MNVYPSGDYHNKMGFFDFLKKKRSITGVVRNPEVPTPTAAEPGPVPTPIPKATPLPKSSSTTNTSGYELTGDGVMSVDPSRSADPRDSFDPRVPSSRGGRRTYRDVGPGPQSTPTTPTPSAGDISGSSAEREQQIQNFREQRRVSPGDSSYGIWLPETERQDDIKRDATAFSVIPSGSIGPDDPTFKDVTYGDIQKDITIKRTVAQTGPYVEAKAEIGSYTDYLQENVDSGFYSVGTATALQDTKVKEVEEKLGKEYRDIGSKYPDVPGLYTKVPKEPIVPFLKEAAILSNPLGISGKLGVAVKDSPLVIDSADSSLKGYINYKPSKDVYIYSGMLLGSAAFGASSFGKYGRLQKDIVAGDFESLGSQTLRDTKIIKDFGKDGLVLGKGTRSFGNLKQEVVFGGEFVKTGDKTFIIPKGQGLATTTGQLSWNPLGGAKPTQVLSSSTFDFGAKGGVLIEGGQASLQFSKSTFIPRMQSSAMFQLPSSSREAVKTGSSIGRQWGKNAEFGGTTDINLDFAPSVKVGKNLYFGGTPKVSGGYSDIGFTKVIKKAPEKEGVTVFRGGGGGTKTPFSTTYAPPVMETPQVSTKVISTGLDTQTKNIGSNLFKGRSVLGIGGGLKQTTKQRGILVSGQSIKSALASQSKQRSITTLGLGSQLSPRVRSKTDTLQVPMLGQASSIKLATSSIQKSALINPPRITPRIRTPVPKIPSKGFLPKIPLPPFPKISMGAPAIGKPFGGKTTTGFSTSFTGYARGITKAPTKSVFGKTGFEVRPLSSKGDIIFKVKRTKRKK